MTGVTVSPATVVIKQGGTKTFSAAVKGTNSPAQTVTWTIVTTGVAEGTKFADNVLTIAADESKTTITVKATSTADTGKEGAAAVKIVPSGTTGAAILASNGFLSDDAVSEALALTAEGFADLDETALASVKTAVEAVLANFGGLSPEAKALLGTEKAKLDYLLAVIVSIETGGTTPETTPEALIDFIGETLTGLTAGADYTVNDGAKTADASGTIPIENGWFGTTISIKKTGNGTTTLDSAAQSLTVPARPAISGVTAIQPAVIGGTGGINGTTSAMEYKRSTDSAWTAIAGSSVTGLAAGSYAVRIKTTASSFKSAEVFITIDAFPGTAETKPNAAINYTTEKLTGLSTNANYTVNTIAKTADASGTIAIENDWFGTTISIKKTGNGTTTVDSAAQSLTVPARPAISGVTAIQPAVIGGTGGISGTTSNMEYKRSTDSGWTAITGSSVTGLAAGSYAVRVKATASSFKSAEVSVTIGDFGAAAETTPAAAINYTTEKFTGLSANANYTVNTITKTADASGTIAIESGWFGTTVSIKKTGNGTTTVDSAAQSRAVPSRPAISGVTAVQPAVIGGTGRINGTTSTMEYKRSTDSGWTAITGSSVTGLATGSYVVRIKAAENAFKSAEVFIIINAPPGPTAETTPAAAINYTTEKFTGLSANANYTVNTITKTADASGMIAIESGWFGTTVSIKKTGNGTTTVDSAAQSRAVPSRPAISGVTAVQPAVIGGTGRINGTTSAMEYKRSTDSGWTAITGSSVTGLAAGSYAVRVKATASSFKSAEVSITISVFTGTAETTPAAGINYSTEKLTGLANGNYIINSNNLTVSDGTYSIASLISTSSSVSLSIVKKGNGTTTTDSATQSLTIPARPGAPTGVAGGINKITGTTTAMEYKTASGGSWAACSAAETAVAVGSYVVRLKAAGSAFAGTQTGTLTVSATTYGISLNQTGTYTFPATAPGYGAQTAKNITITNTGNQATGTLTVTLSGTNSGSFSRSPATVSSITAGNTGTFTVVPNTGLGLGTYTATVTVSGGNGITASFGVSFTVSKVITVGNVITASSSATAAELSAALTAYLSSASGGSSTANPVAVSLAITNADQLSTGSGSSVDALGVLFDAIPEGKYVAYDLSGSTFSAIGDTSYTLAFSRAIQYLTAITMPTTLQTLGDNVFHNCTALTTVNLPAVTTIGDSAFRYCTALTTVNFPVATTIDDFAFIGCYALTTVNLPAVTTIGNGAFNTCQRLTTVNLPAAIMIGTGAFGTCNLNLTTVNLPVATTIGDSAFSNCTVLTTVSLPAATTIGEKAFDSCSALTTVRLGATPPSSLGANIFLKTEGTAAPSRKITIAWPTGAGVQSAYTTWLSTNSSKWGVNLPTGGIVLATSGYTP
ncbi:hypothetical protein FACS189442_0900 [Spirochaetia bacterium]|nr:hypothetical protein FACS189442_0900 [Spirochaetia bacterium]